MNIIKQLLKLVNWEGVDVNSLPSMTRDPDAAYIPPVCVVAPHSPPRMSYRRR